MTAPRPRASPAGWLRRDELPVVALLLVWVALCAAQTLTFEFIHYDDPLYVLENPLVSNPSSVPFLHRLTTPEVGYPTPLGILTYRLQYLLVGFDRGGPWHAVNVLLHLGSVALVFVIARSVGLGRVGATLASVLFALHPAAAEPVAWITGRKDLLALFFSLLAVALALNGDVTSRRHRATEIVAFLLALASKPTAVALAPILVMLSWGSIEGADAKARLAAAIRRRAPEIAAAFLVLPIAYLGHRNFGGLRDDEHWVSTVRSAWYGLGLHLGLIAGVEAPCITHFPDAIPPPFTPRLDLLPLVVGVALALVARGLDPQRKRVFWGGLACALLAYLPSSGIVPMRRFGADSYVYPVLPGFAIALATVVDSWIEGRAVERLVRRVLVPAIALLLGLLFAISAGRFRSTRDIWAHAMTLHPDRWYICKDWAVSTREVAGPQQTLEATDFCIARFGPLEFEKNRAIALYELGRMDEAAEWLKRALAHDPEARDAPPDLLERAR